MSKLKPFLRDPGVPLGIVILICFGCYLAWQYPVVGLVVVFLTILLSVLGMFFVKKWERITSIENQRTALLSVNNRLFLIFLAFLVLACSFFVGWGSSLVAFGNAHQYAVDNLHFKATTTAMASNYRAQATAQSLAYDHNLQQQITTDAVQRQKDISDAEYKAGHGALNEECTLLPKNILLKQQGWLVIHYLNADSGCVAVDSKLYFATQRVMWRIIPVSAGEQISRKESADVIGVYSSLSEASKPVCAASGQNLTNVEDNEHIVCP